MRYPAYDRYKNTKYEWMNSIPFSWDIMNLSHAVRMKSGENITSLEILPAGAYPVYGGNGVRGFFDTYTHSGEYILIGRQGALCGNINLVKGIFWASEHAVVVAPDRELNIDWLGYLLISMNLNQYSVSAAQPGLSVESIGRLKIPVPIIDEQQKISDFLDFKTQQIDQIIEKKKALIEKLNEQRIAVVTQAVTKGLDKNAKMKSSDVDWLGDVPAHWELKKLKFMASIKNGRDYKHIENNEGYDVIGSGGPFAKASEYLFDGESVLFGRKGTIDTPLFVSKKFWTVDTMFYSVIEPDIIAKYLYYSATIIPFKYLATQTALPSMTQFDLENHVLACPNKNEQEEIVTYIEKKLNRIDNMVRINKDAIDVYGEYRNSLVTAAVTGKIDVRDFSLNKGVA